MDYIKTKVSQRLGVLQRIKHLLPRDTRELFVKAMVLPILDYADVTWGDKSNTTLMNKIQLLQNKAAKLILHMPKHSSATEALDLLGWDTLEKRRRSHCLFLSYFFVKKYLLVGASSMLWAGESVSGSVDQWISGSVDQ